MIAIIRLIIHSGQFCCRMEDWQNKVSLKISMLVYKIALSLLHTSLLFEVMTCMAIAQDCLSK